jgi:hypothetical protein
MEDALADKTEMGSKGRRPGSPAKDDDVLTKLVNWFEESEEQTTHARQVSEKCRDYYDNIQWTSEEISKLNDRKQPALTFNHAKRKINFLLGHEQERRSDPKAFPRNVPNDEEGATAATDTLRYVQEDQDLPAKFSDVFEYMMLEGFGGVEVLYNAKKGCVEVKGWDWDRLFYDPYSSKHDFSDAMYLGGVVWTDESRLKARYPDKVAVIEGTVSTARSEWDANSETYNDKPRHNVWVDFRKRPRLRVVQIYWNDSGKWQWAHYVRGGFLLGPKDVAFVNEDGESECPLILQSAYVNRENERYGEMLELLDRQDEINKRRSKLLHLVSVRQVIAEAGAVDNVEKARSEVARPDGYLEIAPGKKFEIDTGADLAKGQAELLQEAKMEMEQAGPNAALMGKQDGAASGRAIIASQQGGITELSRVFGRYKHFKTRVYRQVWNRVKQFWTDEKWIRVTDNERNIKFVGLNRMLTMGELAMKQAQAQGMPPEELQKFAQIVQQDPQSQQPSDQKANDVASMDMDIIIDEGPDTITVQQEQFEEIVKLAQAGIPFAPEDLIEMSSLRNKDKVLERIKQRSEQQAGMGAPPPEVVEAELRVKHATAFDKEQTGIGKEIDNAAQKASLLLYGPDQPSHVQKQDDRAFDAAKTMDGHAVSQSEAERARQFQAEQARQQAERQPAQ